MKSKITKVSSVTGNGTVEVELMTTAARVLVHVFADATIAAKRLSDMEDVELTSDETEMVVRARNKMVRLASAAKAATQTGRVMRGPGSEF